jgi:hypothetical protein
VCSNHEFIITSLSQATPLSRLVAGFFMRGRMGDMKQFQISLRLVLLLVTLLAVFLAGVGTLIQTERLMLNPP